MRKTTKLMLTVSAVTVGLTGVLPMGANAQIDEILVTARKREESLQSAPISVSALTSENFEQLGIQSIDDIARFTPGLVFSNTFGRSTERPVIRGAANILASVQFGVESGTAYFINGAYYPGDIQTLDLSQIERVEVIKGPQSALYGRNSYGGAINFITKDPTEEFSGSGTASYAEHDEWEVKGSMSGPIVEDKLGFTVSARHWEYGGEYTNRLNGQTVGQEETNSISAGLTLTPNENVTIKVDTFYNSDEDGTRALALQNSDQNNCFPGQRSDAFYDPPRSSNGFQYFCGVVESQGFVNLTEPEDVAGDDDFDGFTFAGVERDRTYTAASLDWDLGGSGYTLSLLGGYLSEELKTGSDSTHQGDTSTDIITVVPGVIEIPTQFGAAFMVSAVDERDDYSIEARISSPAEDQIRWSTGLYYYESEVENFDFSRSLGKVFDFRNETLNRAVFGSAEWDVTDAFTIGGEVRYASERKRDSGAALSGEFESTTYRITADYQVNDDLLLYAVHATGNKPGGFNGSIGLDVNLPTYDEEEATTYEIGAKSTWFDGLLQANIAAYYNENSNYQLTTPVATGTGTLNSVVTNQGDVEVKGIELELLSNPIEGLDLGLTYAWTDAEFTEGCDAFQYTLTSGGLVMSDVPNVPIAGSGTPLPGASCSIVGNQVPMTAEHQLSVFGGWTAPLANGIDYFIRSDFTYESSKFAQVHNGMETGDSKLLGARVGLQGENWKLTAFGRNLLDEDSVILVTRWFDTAAGQFDDNCDDNADCSPVGPRAGFYGLRKGRQFGVEASFNF